MIYIFRMSGDMSGDTAGDTAGDTVDDRRALPSGVPVGFRSRLFEELRILIVAGIVAGVLLVGVGSRLAMLVLRLTSPDRVIGIRSDDDFEIGRFTVGGTYNLLMLGAVVGIIGAGVYRLVAPWLIGPMWFRRFTTAAASAVVGGSMLVHADGIDFRLLKPTWLAIGLFVALPAVFGAAIGPVVDRVADPDSWTRQGRRIWVVPVALVVPFPLTVLPIVLAAVVIAVLMAIDDATPIARLRSTVGYQVVVRGAWLGIAVIGLFALIEDVRQIRDVV